MFFHKTFHFKVEHLICGQFILVKLVLSDRKINLSNNIKIGKMCINSVKRELIMCGVISMIHALSVVYLQSIVMCS